jgi:hypothetical protein
LAGFAFCIVPWLYVQERILEFRLSQRYTMMIGIIQSIRLLAQSEWTGQMQIPEYEKRKKNCMKEKKEKTQTMM